MNYTEALTHINQWLSSGKIPFGSEQQGFSLDEKGCLTIFQSKERQCILMLPEEETSLFYLTSLHTPNLDHEVDLLPFSLYLNSLYMGFLNTSAIGFDADSRQIILRGTLKLNAQSYDQLSKELEQFLDQADVMRQLIHEFRFSDNDTTTEGDAIRSKMPPSGWI